MMIQRIFRKVLKLCAPLLPDKIFLRLRYRVEMGKALNLEHPRTLNEKIQWLKLYDRQPHYTTLVDKLLVKDYIRDKIGAEYVIKTLGIWQFPEEIDFTSLPNRFVLKTNHSGGNTGVIICKDKLRLNLSDVKKRLTASLRSDIFRNNREWPYKNVKRLIFAEEYLEDTTNKELIDYKFYCFNGYVDSVMICIDRQIGKPKFYFFDKEWNFKRYDKRAKNAPDTFTLPRPENMDKMFEIASVLSKDIPFVRVDIYNVNGHVYFGEMTFYSASGFDTDLTPEADLYLGNLISLNLKLNNSN